MAKKKDTEILRHVEGIPIRKYNNYSITLNENEMEKFARLHAATGLSIPKILALLASPCSICGNDNITLVIPRGILSNKKSTNGGTISSHHKK